MQRCFGFLQAAGVGLQAEAEALNLAAGWAALQRQGAPQIQAPAPLLDPQPGALSRQLRIEVFQATTKVHG